MKKKTGLKGKNKGAVTGNKKGIVPLKYFRILKYVVIVIIIGAILPLISFGCETNIGTSITSQIAKSPSNAFDTYFTFSNEGHFVLTNIKCAFTVLEAQIEDRIVLSDVTSEYQIEGKVYPGHRVTKQTGISVESDYTIAKMKAEINYTPLFGFINLPTRQDQFYFEAIKTVTGYYWIEQSTP
ncbi:MAG: hypothetical protein JXA46_19065 [Dehalococcoidales bacterium]|nr:hypothetical protein [Dehalococcoidales bacterium]